MWVFPIFHARKCFEKDNQKNNRELRLLKTEADIPPLSFELFCREIMLQLFELHKKKNARNVDDETGWPEYIVRGPAVR